MNDHEEVFAYKRELSDETLLVYCNFYDGEPRVDILADDRVGDRSLFISNYEVDHDSVQSDEIILKPYEVRVYHVKK